MVTTFAQRSHMTSVCAQS